MDYSFQPVSSLITDKPLCDSYELNCDRRIRSKHRHLYKCLCSKQSSIIHRLSDHYKDIRSFYRFLNNPNLEIRDLINKHCQLAPALLHGRHVLVLGDGVSFNLEAAHGRMQEEQRRQLGVLENNQTPGMMVHLGLAIDANSNDVLGLGDICLYNRQQRHVGFDKRRHRLLSYEQKESSKWLIVAKNAQQHLRGSQHLTYVYDREADRFQVLAHLDQIENSSFVIRADHDRKVSCQGRRGRVNELMNDQPIQGSYQLAIRPLNHLIRSGRARKRRVGRTSTMEVRWLAVDEIEVPNGLRKINKSLKNLEGPLYYVQVKEKAKDVPPGEQPIQWLILTTHQVNHLKQAQTIIHYYQQRWHIEQLFRVCKKQGFELESTQLQSVEAIMKLLVMTMGAACQIMQINLAREQDNPIDIDFVFDKNEQQLLQKINTQVSGKTKLLKNPYPSTQLNWATWIIARLGGWKGYSSQGPPGPITISRGFKELQTYFKAWSLFNTS